MSGRSYANIWGYRSGNWKLILARGSGGWSSPKENQLDDQFPEAQLYDLSQDIGEQKNLYDSRRDVANRLLTQLQSEVKAGRTTPGPKSDNDVKPIKL